jgi:hypothetical protein
MGWKNVKEHYRIGHLVCVTHEGISIGSPYCPNLIVIGNDGRLRKEREALAANKELVRYQTEMEADPAKLKELIDTPDTFERSIPIWTYDGGDIIEKQCEDPEPLNVTHDGQLIYENRHSTDRQKVVAFAKRNAEAGIELIGGQIEEVTERLLRLHLRLDECKTNLNKLRTA